MKTPPQPIQTGWTDILMICRKCTRKLQGGFGPGGKDTIRQALRTPARRRRIGLVDVKCLGVCPRKGVTILQASRPGTLRIVPAGAEMDSLLD